MTSLRKRASREEVTLNSNLSNKLQSASMPLYTITKRLSGTSISNQLGVVILSAHRVLANGHVLIGLPFEPACTCGVDHVKFKTKKIYSQGILVNYIKVCTNENFPLYDTICSVYTENYEVQWLSGGCTV